MTPVVRNIVFGAVGIAVLFGFLFQLTAVGPTPTSTKSADVSGQTIFWFTVLAAIGASLLSGYIKAKPFSKSAWLLVLAIPLWWLIWGAGWDAVGSRVGEARPAGRFISIPLQAGLWSWSVDIPPCTGWEVYPEPGQTVWVAAADDGYRKEYRYSPTETPQVSGRGPFKFRGEGQSVRVSLLEPGTYCYKVPKQARTW